MMHRDLSSEKSFAASQYDKEREYWLEKLSGEPVKSSFPADFSTTDIKEKRRETISFKWPPDLFERVMVISNNSDSRLHMLLVTGLSLLLYKYTGHTDIIICTPIDKQEVEGDFINTVLPIRNQMDEQITVKEFLMQIRQTIIEAGENQNYPIETIPYDLDMPVVEDDFPLFDTAVLLQNIQDKQYLQHMNLNMIFSFLRTDDALEGEVEYNTSLYEKETVQRIINHSIYLMQEAFNRVDLKLADVPVLTEEEKKQMIMDFNDTAAGYPRDKMIHQLFEEQVAKNPGNIAVEFNGRGLTYEELNRKAGGLAGFISKKGIGPGDVAAIMLGSSIDVPVAVMAVLKTGAAYLPMGFEYPEERINYLLKDSEAKILLTAKSLADEKNPDCPAIYLEDESLYSGGGENIEPVNNPGSLAYIIYTSGTTGQPKGVMVEHRALVNYIWWAARTYVRNEKIDFPLYTSISFDLTVTSIFTPLITGNTVIVYGGVDKKFYIEEVIEDNRVGVVKLTPSHLKLILPKQLKDSSVKRLIVGGEELETQLAADIYRNFDGKVDIYNEYGPTETVVGSMIYRYNPETDNRHSVPIGVPIANTGIYLLNRHLQPVPVGVEAELYISGDGLARGYFHNSDLTGEKFVSDPFVPGGKMYRTGDLAVRMSNGNIEYRGRIDHQVKIRGYRVETGEIESKIVQFQQMAHAKREKRENIVEKLDLKSFTRCKKCLIPVNYPGGIHFDEEGVCDICREFETYKDKALSYFKRVDDFYKIVERAQKTKKGDYDCLMLYSGGKDSSYVLHRLVDRGLKVLAFTFDNGHISETCWVNIARTTSLLKVKHIVMDSEAMKEIFVESLWSDYNVCNGCFKAVNTFGTKLAHEYDINLVISGLTRGQIFDIQLHGLFKLGTFDEEDVNEQLKLFRKNYHSMTHRTSRLIGVEITDEMLDNIYFADYFRYDNISTSEIFDYLKQKDPKWERPTDTGSSSSNCIINDVGIYVHLKDRGCHFYSAQLSWDCRLGTITREEGIEEITGFKVDYPSTHRVLSQIGYYDAFTGAVVTDVKDEKGERSLCAYILADKEFDIPGLKDYLSGELPDYMIPTYFTRIDKIPLTPSGKVDRKALPDPELDVGEEYVAPRNAVEEKLADVWAEVLGLKKESIGIEVNFFEVGGHSLRATFLAAAIHKEFNVRVPLVKIFEAPTIKGLAQYIKEAAEEVFTSIHTVEKKDYYPLSSAQNRLYILQQMEPESTAYNVNVSFEVEGQLPVERFEETFGKLVARHESLRTSLEMKDETPIQRIHDGVEFKMEFFDTMEGGRNDFIRSFDLSRVPLLRAALISIEPLKHILMVDMHHIVTDGISQAVLIKDFVSLNNDAPFSPLKLQYKDYCVWQQDEATKDVFRKEEEYWIREFGEEVPVLSLPTDFPRPAIQSFEGNAAGFEISAEESRELNEIARSEGATLFMVLLAAFYVFLAKASNQEDIVVGTPIAGRRHTDLEQIIGMFVNTLAVRSDPSGDKTFLQFFGEVKEKILKAFENQDYQIEELVENISLERDLSRNPLFDVVFILQNFFDPSGNTGEMEVEEKGLKIKPYAHEHGTSKFDLTLTAIEGEENVNFAFEYCTRLFREKTVERFIRYFKAVISSIVENPGIKIAEIDVVTEEEKNQILYDFNITDAAYPHRKTIGQLFAEQVEKRPDSVSIIGRAAPAVSNRMVTVTYKELNNQSAGLSHVLTEKGVRPGTIVPVMVQRSVEMVTGILAILKAGGAYLPIDPDYPQERIDFMLKDSNAKILLGIKGEAGKVNEAVEVIDTGAGNGFAPSESSPPSPVITHHYDSAYIIYTSGTTGKPKGVVITHRNVVRLMFNDKFLFDFSPRDIWTMFHSFCFDFSVWEMYGALLYGGQLVIIAREEARDSSAYLDILKKKKVTVLNQTPSAFYQLMNLELENTKKELTIRYVIFGGEALSPPRLKEWKSRYPEIKLINMYGITETTVHVTFKEIGKHETELNVSNIGSPIPTLNTYIMDSRLRLTPLGVPGELTVGGEGVGNGYLNRPELTAEKFIDNPYKPQERLYKSGDLARLSGEGELEYLGRIDQQIKIRGFRIELGEIETQLLSHEDVKAVVVIQKEMGEGDKHICAYIVSDVEFSVSELREYLARKLPDYMVPSYFVPVEKIPLTPNGKIDRKALPEPEAGMVTVEYAAPRDAVEEKLAEVWSGVLGLKKENIGIDADFFEVGGHSLRATFLAAAVHKEFNVRIPLVKIFETPTIRGMAAYIKDSEENKYVGIEPAERKEYYVLSPGQTRLYFLQQVNPDITSYNMPMVLPIGKGIDVEKFKSILKKLTVRHESLRTSFVKVDEIPYQKIHDDVEFEAEYYRYRDDDEEAGTAHSPADILKNFVRPFDLSQPPLLRFGLINVDSPEPFLLIDMHHIVTDGTSRSILMEEFTALFSDADLRLPPLRLQYKDYSQWLFRPTQQEMIKRQEAYWMECLSGQLPVLELPLDYPRPAVKSFEGNSVPFAFTREETAPLKKISEELGTTLYMTMLSILNVLLAKLGGIDDIIVGTPITSRRHADLHRIIGMFINTVVMRNYPSKDKTFKTFLEEVKEQTLSAYENQEYPFEYLVEKVLVKRDAGRNPLFDVMFNFFSEADYSGEIPDSEEENPMKYENRTSKFDLNFTCVDLGAQLLFEVEYCTKLFKSSTIERFIKYFKAVAASVAESVDQKLSDIEIITGQQKEEFLTITPIARK